MNYVTDRELKAHLAPLQADIWEVKADVKTLVLAAAKAQGRDDERAKADTKRRVLSDRRLAYAAIFAGALSPLAWLHVPNPFH